MEALLKFNLPEESDEHYTALNGHNYKFVIQELDNWLRGKVKYEDQDTIDITLVRQKISELVQEHDIKDLW